MALTESSINAGQSFVPQSNNLLDFMNNASSSIKEAMAPSKKKRNVNVRKYIQKRVKRLNDKGAKPSSAQTKNKSVLKTTTKPNSAQQLQAVGSQSWPMIATPNNFSVQSQGYATANYPTLCSPPTYTYNNETSLYQPTTKTIDDAELDIIDSLLSELQSEPSTRHSSAGMSPSYPPSTLESQVYLAEHPYSPPNSDCSDDPFDDSAYSSPVGSVGCNRSAACTPPMPVSEWHSPAITTRCPVTSTVWFQEQPPVTGANWMTQFTSFDQTPQTVSELLPPYY